MLIGLLRACQHAAGGMNVLAAAIAPDNRRVQVLSQSVTEGVQFISRWRSEFAIRIIYIYQIQFDWKTFGKRGKLACVTLAGVHP